VIKGGETQQTRSKQIKLGIEGLSKLPKERQTEFNGFISDIEKIPYFRPDGKPDKRWRVFYGDTLAEARIAAWTAWAAAWNAAGNGAVDRASNAALAACTACNATGNGAGGAAMFAAWKAWSAAWNAAEKAASSIGGNAAGIDTRIAARDAAEDAASMGRLIAVKNLDFEGKDKCIGYANERMNVWRKGYGLAAEVNGVLYVYCVRKSATERIQLRLL